MKTTTETTTVTYLKTFPWYREVRVAGKTERIDAGLARQYIQAGLAKVAAAGATVTAPPTAAVTVVKPKAPPMLSTKDMTATAPHVVPAMSSSVVPEKDDDKKDKSAPAPKAAAPVKPAATYGRKDVTSDKK